MNLEEWLPKNEKQLGSPYEKIFVIKVLASIVDIDFAAIRPQFGFKDTDGKARYCDFVLQEGKTVKIAIEIDGYDKRGSGSGMSREDFVDWQRRQAALVSQGWRVLRFANTDVRDHPELCRQHLELLLRGERENSTHMNGLKETIRQLIEQLTKAEHESDARVEKNILTEQVRVLQHQLELAQGNRPLAPDEVAVLQQLNAAQSEIGILQEENSVMKTTIWAFTALLAVMIVTFAFKMGAINSTEAPIPQPQTALPVIAQQAQAVEVSHVESEKQKVTKTQDVLPAKAKSVSNVFCKNSVNWSHAKQYTGKKVAIQGPIVRVTQRQDVQGSPTWIEIGAAYPSESRLTLVVWGDDRSAFEPVISSQLQSRIVCVKGIVQLYRQLPQIELHSPEQWVLK